MLYAIQAGDAGPIKLGHATDPRKRLKALQIAHHERLHLRAAWPGHTPNEWELHERFACARLSGEWFEPTSELIAFVAERAVENHPLEGTSLREQYGPQDDDAFELAARLPPSRATRVDRAMTTLFDRAARAPLNPVTEAQALVALLKELRLTQEQLASRLGTSQETISHTMRLLRLPSLSLSSRRRSPPPVGPLALALVVALVMARAMERRNPTVALTHERRDG